MTASTPRSRRTPLLLGTAAAVSVAVVAAVMVALGSSPYDVVSLRYPGNPSVALLGAARITAMLSGAVAVGGAVTALVVVRTPPTGLVGVDGFAALQLASRAATVWSVAALVMVLGTSADGAGLSIAGMISSGATAQAYSAVDQPTAWTVTWVAAMITAVLTRFALTWSTALVSLGFSLPGVVAPGLVGNSGQGLDHDLATNLVLLHGPAAAVWLGVMATGLFHLRRSAPSDTPPESVVTRLRQVSLWSVIMLGVTGLGLTWTQVRVPEDLDAYLGTVLVQAAALLVLGAIAVYRLRRAGRSGPLSVVPDILVVLGTFAAAAVAGRLPSPSLLHTSTTAHQIMLGYDVPGPWTVVGLLTRWRIDTFWLMVAAFMVGAYLLGVRRAGRAGAPWPAVRTVSWTAGWVLVVLSTSSGINTWAGAQFSMHMVLHLVLNLAAAPLLVAGGPLGLVTRVSGPTDVSVSGPRDWVALLVGSPVMRWLTRGPVALGIYVLTLFGVYFTPLFDELIRYHWGHQVMNIHFLVTGVLFFWPILGVDLPADRRLGPVGRIAMLLAIMPFHAIFGVVLMTHTTVLGSTFYESLALTDRSALLADQRLGGILAWISGEIPALVGVGLLLVRWMTVELRGGGPGDEDGALERELHDVRS